MTELVDDVMTSVRVLCLNHKLAFGVFDIGDSDGEERLDVCKAAGHRVLFFMVLMIEHIILLGYIQCKTSAKSQQQ
jgi:hypothetical protein